MTRCLWRSFSRPWRDFQLTAVSSRRYDARMKPLAIRYRLFASLIAAGILTSLASTATAADNKSGGVQISDQDGKLAIKIGGQLFSEYYYKQYDHKDVPRPFFYPINGPGGARMTRDWPMKDVASEEHDHPHHRSLWYAHGEINGQDFWAESPKSGKTVHVAFTEIKSGADVGVIKTQNKLVAADGTTVCTDDRIMRIYNRANDRMMDFEITIHASQGNLTFGDTKEGTMALRLAETMRLKKNKVGTGGQGHIVNSEGVADDKTWGKRAAWVDYYGPVHGKTVGVAIFDHPKNLRHPTWWMARDYGLFGANPFGWHDYEKEFKDEPHKGDHAIPAGGSLTLRYRLYFHTGDEKTAKLAARYAEYAAGK